MKKNPKYKQGIYTLSNPEKYKGNKKLVIYRSGWELKAMRFFDYNPSVVEWSSEETIVPYHNPLTGRTSRYFVDFNLTLKDKSGAIKKFLVEIKPAVQTLPPKPTRNTRSLLRRQAEYVKNRAKWDAARQFATKKDSTFIILTEKHLGLAK